MNNLQVKRHTISLSSIKVCLVKDQKAILIDVSIMSLKKGQINSSYHYRNMLYNLITVEFTWYETTVSYFS